MLARALLLAWNLPGAARRRAGLPAEPRTVLLRALGLLAAAPAVALVVLAVVNGWTVTVLGIPLPPRTFPEFALDAAILLPTAALLTPHPHRAHRPRGASRGRRAVGRRHVLARWFHPLAPPTYSDRAVRGLADQLDADLDAAGHRLLLAPHSQGAVIAATAVLAGPRGRAWRCSATGPRGATSTASSSPAHVNPASTAAVAARLDDGSGPRWRSLHRATDPIGGPIEGIDDPDPLADPHHRGHSDYWVETAYHHAVTELRSTLDGAVEHVIAPPAMGREGDVPTPGTSGCCSAPPTPAPPARA